MMEEKIVLKRMNVEELGGLYEAMRPIWLETYSFLPKEQVELLLNKYFSKNGVEYYLDNGYEYYSLNGAGLLVIKEQKDGLYVDKLYIQPEFRRKGLASNVFQYLIKTRKKALALNVNKNNLPAVSCYLKNGFKIAKEEIIELGNGLVNCDYVMIKEIK
jgi:ribosomal protein S18 acetylase RimI-like enzyme